MRVSALTVLFCLAVSTCELPGQESKTKPQSTKPAAAAHDANEEAAIRKAGDAYVKAFNKADIKSLMEHYTADAEYIDQAGAVSQGQAAIEKSLQGYFAANPESTMVLSIEAIRLIGPGLAIEDGTVTITVKGNPEASLSRYTAVQAKHGGKWLLASIRDAAVSHIKTPRTQLKELEWMLGDWVHEGRDGLVSFSCKLVDNGNFLVRDYKFQIAGQESHSGTQRIGWDAQAGKFKAWIFDSDGSHSEGYWHRDGDSWELKLSGVTADGRSASSTTSYTLVNPHTMTFQSKDHEVGGIEFPDGSQLKIVRNAPRPE